MWSLVHSPKAVQNNERATINHQPVTVNVSQSNTLSESVLTCRVMPTRTTQT
ncbi:hypothetical protein [Vibrio parahaemolyticus]|uniref:hypothetical protein n=1 Tax=Vibrio parahaemolyticus TaxID=670 RepID=UPI0007201C67|nr:hypothetical protein [Vibrio parahaemolyticus]ALM67640.1 hypothetical protein FORC4_2667 [Vibrio parahaemolyticus]EIE1212539.1 hypothetical protein [Vibrio parahaemolyticus]EJC7075801.1 hypothetical protein [Vibrio parahaemolyticus]EKN4539070.1 hypothetical protein [Vibrio parahaemolyticus]MBD6945563.1 hypothetical protein [Vibrio parahaemolyticus]